MVDPKNFAAYAVSDSQAILTWDKPTGYDYAFLMVYRPAIEIRYKVIQALQGFGTMEMAILKDLRPGTRYYAQVEFYCAGAQSIRSHIITMEFNTLPTGWSF